MNILNENIGRIEMECFLEKHNISAIDLHNSVSNVKKAASEDMKGKYQKMFEILGFNEQHLEGLERKVISGNIKVDEFYAACEKIISGIKELKLYCQNRSYLESINNETVETILNCHTPISKYDTGHW